MISSHRKSPTKRVFSGLAGSSLSVVSVVPSQSKPKNPRKELVLAHFCFDQEHGESKPDRCNCKLRVPKDRAYDLVDAKQADFLLIKNPKTDQLTKFHRAIVIRRMTVAGETLFAVAPPVKVDRRDVKHEQIKNSIRLRARGILHRLFAAKAISPSEMRMPDCDLEAILQDTPKLNAFLEKLSGQKRLRNKWVEVSLSWWNNILGYHRLDENAGQFLRNADRGTGITVSGTNDKQSLTERLQLTDGKSETDTGRVPAANFRPSYWNGAWDYSAGTDPLAFERGKIHEE